VDVDGALELVEGVVDGVADGVDRSPPMFGQSPRACPAAMVESATAGVEVDSAAEPKEPVVAWATAPPASAAVAASVTAILRARGSMCVHLLFVVSRSEPTPCKSHLWLRVQVSEGG
jgi:hypothetical protein